MTKLFKALGATLLAAGLVVAGVAAPAQALTGTISVSSFTAGTATGFTFSTGSTNATSVGQLDFKVYNNTNQPTSFAPVASCASFASCQITSVKFGSTTWTQEGNQGGRIVSVAGTVAANNQSQSHILFSFSGTGLSLTNEAIEVVFATGALTPPNTNGNYTAEASVSASSFLSFTAPVTVSGAPSTVRFFRNYSNMDFTSTTQSSLGQANLTLNSFTNPNNYFQGWATTAGGTVAYLDGASYSFATNQNLYAVWSTTPPAPSNNTSNQSSDPTLANTGIDAKPYLYGGLALAIVGSALLLIARRKQTN
jgi:LPXTG-motif cell wall-anchored protein